MIHLDHIKGALVNHHLMDEASFNKYLEDAKQKEISFEEYLVQLKLISEEELYENLSAEYQIPFVNLVGKKIHPETLELIPESIAQAHQIIAFDQKDQDLCVATLDPDDLQTFDFIAKTTKLHPKPFLTSHHSLREALRLYHKDIEEELEMTRIEEEIPSAQGGMAELDSAEKLAKNLPIIRIVDSILKSAVYEDASDIHIEPSEENVVVRFRVDGLLRQKMTLPLNVQPGIAARIKVLANLKLDEHRLPQDGRFKISTEEFHLTARVSVIPVYGGEKIVLRLLDDSPQLLSFEELGLGERGQTIVRQSIHRPHGIILATGPTGSGKTTTLYTILNELNKPEVNISTIEDPIEYRMRGINQSQVNPKIGYTFASGLRSFLRQDPNIIMVGEIRDSETAKIAAQAAMTGHLVLSTLHTNDAITALPRLSEMGVELFLIASTINLVIAQRLVRKICEKCLESYVLSEHELKEVEQTLGISSLTQHLAKLQIRETDVQREELRFYRGKGCEECGDDGYKGRIGLFEILEVSKPISEAITKRASTEELKTLALQEGMLSLEDDGLLKALNGQTTLEELLRVTQD